MNITKYLINDIIRIIFRFLPWVIIGFLIGVINVSAETITAIPDQINFYRAYNNTLVGSDTSMTTYTIAGNTFYGGNSGNFEFSPLSARIFYKSSQFSSVPKKKTSSLMFTLFTSKPINSVSIDTDNNYFTCDIFNTSYYNLSIENEAIVYSIYCPKMQFISPNFYINVNFNNSTVLNSPLGVQNKFTYIIDENTNINNSIQEGNNKLDNINDSLNSSDTDNNNVSDTIDNINIGNEGVITQLITMPITLFTNVLNSINGSCATFNLGNLLGTNLSLPCINLENYLGSSLWSVIDVILSGFLAWGISKKIKNVFEQLTNLREGDILD